MLDAITVTVTIKKKTQSSHSVFLYMILQTMYLLLYLPFLLQEILCI
jgi:hypothetical protein